MLVRSVRFQFLCGNESQPGLQQYNWLKSWFHAPPNASIAIHIHLIKYFTIIRNIGFVFKSLFLVTIMRLENRLS